MKLKNIHRHTVRHMWQAYVKEVINENPEYWTKRKNGLVHYIYKKDQSNEPEEVLNYDMFRYLVEQFFSRAKLAIINGEAVNIPNVGRICAKRIQRDFRSKNKPIDWGRTNAAGRDENGKYKKMYYFTEDEYCRIGFFKMAILNIHVYQFKPTNPGMTNREGGFNKEFSRALTNDPLLKYRYLYCPLRDYVVKEQIA